MTQQPEGEALLGLWIRATGPDRWTGGAPLTIVGDRDGR
jgi:hypothetical protein